MTDWRREIAVVTSTGTKTGGGAAAGAGAGGGAAAGAGAAGATEGTGGAAGAAGCAVDGGGAGAGGLAPWPSADQDGARTVAPISADIRSFVNRGRVMNMGKIVLDFLEFTDWASLTL